MIKSKGIIIVENGRLNLDELDDNLAKLRNDDGEYGFLLFDKKKNKALPILKYLNGIVLSTISAQHPNHPSVTVLYKFFEEQFAPTHREQIDGSYHTYQDLKSEKVEIISQAADAIIKYAKENWGIDVLSRENLKLPDAAAPYADAYANQWTEESRTI